MKNFLSEQTKNKILRSRGKTIACGLCTATKEEISGAKEWLMYFHIPYEHRTHTSKGEKLPYNGVLIINPKEKKC